MAHLGTSQYDPIRSDLEPLLTLRMVCELLAVSKQTVYRLIRAGELSPTRVGERLRFERDDIRSYLDRSKATP